MTNPLLANQVAVVTGGGRGIGRAIGRALADAGARVALLARSAAELADTVRLVEERGGRAQAFPLDVTDAAAVAGTLGAVARDLGPVDVLVNNAATFGPIGPIWETDAGEWWRTMDVNVRGPLLCLQAVLPEMVARRRGKIINVVTGTSPRPYFSAYLASKTALIRLTECVAREVRPFGIAVFAMGPGTVRTAMSEGPLQSAAGRQWLPWVRRIFDEGLDLPPERATALALTLASGAADVLTGLVVQPTDDLKAMIDRVSEIEREQLHSLCVRTLAGPAGGPLAAILAEAERAVS
ncbi:MAG TPA: SDR family oxidoreductase [Gemmatimonadales bacterium]|nr:SDR family oxidoreductase [Gemmatimonadales bacterium]